MAQETSKKGPDPRTVYADIIDHPHWESKTRPHMSLYDRAAQFSPFAALTGYDDMVSEEARIVDKKIEPGEDELECLDRELSIIKNMINRGMVPEVSVTYFVPDPLKAGGRYETSVEQIKKIDVVNGKLVLMRTEGTKSSTKKHVEIDVGDILKINHITEE